MLSGVTNEYDAANVALALDETQLTGYTFVVDHAATPSVRPCSGERSRSMRATTSLARSTTTTSRHTMTLIKDP